MMNSCTWIDTIPTQYIPVHVTNKYNHIICKEKSKAVHSPQRPAGSYLKVPNSWTSFFSPVSLDSSSSHEYSVDGRQWGDQVLDLWGRGHPLAEDRVLGGKRRGNAEHAGSRSCGGVYRNIKTLIYLYSCLPVTLHGNILLTCSGFRLGEVRPCRLPSWFIQDVQRIVDIGVDGGERPETANAADDGHVLVNQRCHPLVVQVTAVPVVTWD